jgi:hypothetical protein
MCRSILLAVSAMVAAAVGGLSTASADPDNPDPDTYLYESRESHIRFVAGNLDRRVGKRRMVLVMSREINGPSGYDYRTGT